MACPICDHSMQQIIIDRTFWCPRCGTLKNSITPESFDVPSLVPRLREFCGELKDEPVNDVLAHVVDAFNRLSIYESISMPGQ